MSTQDLNIFSPYPLGGLQLKNRAIMAPLTRSRAEDGNVPSPMAPQYYSGRAAAGLIITEATQAGAGGQGYVSTPGVYSEEQIAAWKKVTAAVHAKGGLIFVQLWHVGRISHPDFRGGELPVAPSAIAPRGVSTYTPMGLKPIPTPRALYSGTLMVAGGYTLARANSVLQDGLADLVTFGKLFLANPDLIDRFRLGAPLNTPNPETFYSGGAKGYIDYPTLETL